MFAALTRIPLLVFGPALCWARGHHWHTWLRSGVTMRVCDRCGFTVDDPRH